jgi:hypothetical protein
MVQDQVDGGTGDEGHELLHELDGLEQQMGSPITPHRFECDKEASIGTELDAVLGDGSAEEMAGYFKYHEAVRAVILADPARYLV